LAKALPQHTAALVVAQVMGAAPAGMVAMGMGNDGTLHRAPWIDVEIAIGAVEAFISKMNEGHANKNADKNRNSHQHEADQLVVRWSAQVFFEAPYYPYQGMGHVWL
jgi:hypothetical protein